MYKKTKRNITKFECIYLDTKNIRYKIINHIHTHTVYALIYLASNLRKRAKFYVETNGSCDRHCSRSKDTSNSRLRCCLATPSAESLKNKVREYPISGTKKSWLLGGELAGLSGRVNPFSARQASFSGRVGGRGKRECRIGRGIAFISKEPCPTSRLPQ